MPIIPLVWNKVFPKAAVHSSILIKHWLGNHYEMCSVTERISWDTENFSASYMLGTLGIPVFGLGASDVQTKFGLIYSVLSEASWKRQCLLDLLSVGWMVKLCCHEHFHLINKMISNLWKISISRETFKMVRVKWDHEV